MLYDLFSDFFTYIQAIGLAWFSVVGFSVPFVVNEALSRSEWYQNRAARFAGPEFRRAIFFNLLMLSIFWAGFLAWRDEHDARIQADTKYDDLLSRNNFAQGAASRIDIQFIGRSPSGTSFEIQIRNNGSIPAHLYRTALDLQYVNDEPNRSNVNQIMINLENFVSRVPPEQGYETQILPGHWQKFSVLPRDASPDTTINEDRFKEFSQGGSRLFLALTAIYKDDALMPSNQFRMVKFCAYYERGDFNIYYLCPGENKTRIISIKR